MLKLIRLVASKTVQLIQANLLVWELMHRNRVGVAVQQQGSMSMGQQEDYEEEYKNDGSSLVSSEQRFLPRLVCLARTFPPVFLHVHFVFHKNNAFLFKKDTLSLRALTFTDLAL